MIITATNAFVTQPIADRFDIPHLIATKPEFANGRYTGRVSGTPSYRDGKVERLQEWLRHNNASLDGAWFYSDSHNDLPLLRLVDNPIAVDPDQELAEQARRRAWPVISLRDGCDRHA